MSFILSYCRHFNTLYVCMYVLCMYACMYLCMKFSANIIHFFALNLMIASSCWSRPAKSLPYGNLDITSTNSLSASSINPS